MNFFNLGMPILPSFAYGAGELHDELIVFEKVKTGCHHVQHKCTGLGVEISQDVIPWAHEISTPSPVHFAVHGPWD
jgi:hypothetical protein